ncbi:hypothetical protein GJ496_011361 [Pomphorhynchus laevis]|nr:hypothetical protein GJ496_011361 [Pomphorhynchus laevis]
MLEHKTKSLQLLTKYSKAWWRSIKEVRWKYWKEVAKSWILNEGLDVVIDKVRKQHTSNLGDENHEPSLYGPRWIDYNENYSEKSFQSKHIDILKDWPIAAKTSNNGLSAPAVACIESEPQEWREIGHGKIIFTKDKNYSNSTAIQDSWIAVLLLQHSYQKRKKLNNGSQLHTKLSKKIIVLII